MDIAKRIQEFNKRWNISEEVNYKEEFNQFKIRVLNIFFNIDNCFTRDGISTFCQALGIPEKWEERDTGLDYITVSKNVINSLRQDNGEREFYRLLQIIFDLPMINFTYTGGNSKSFFFKKLSEAINFSKVNLAITMKDDEVILYPTGEKEFDQKLVNEVLSFLNDDSQKHFIDALKFYEKKNSKDAIKSAESLRRALEEFLRFKLKNKHGLDANIKELQKRLKTGEKDTIIRNIIFQIFSYLDQYFNENSKHQDGNIDESENEYLIYQTGILTRYIDKIL